MKNKKTFIMYADQKIFFDEMPDELAGKVIKHLFAYVNDENPLEDDLLLRMAFAPFKRQLKYDLKEWGKEKTKNSISGIKGNLKRWHPDLYNLVETGQMKLEEAVSIGGDRKTSGGDKKDQKTIGVIAVKDKDKDKDKDKVKEKDNIIKAEKLHFSESIYKAYHEILKSFPEHLHPKNKNTWLDTIEKLNRIDKIPLKHIIQIVEKIRADDFWSKNFLSLTKLRKTNNDGIKYVVVFFEHLKRGKNGKQTDKELWESAEQSAINYFGNQ